MPLLDVTLKRTVGTMTATAVGTTIEIETETETETENGKENENVKRAEIGTGTGIESLHEVHPQNQHHRDQDMIAANLLRARGQRLECAK
jgi:hypothetical protein